MRIKSIQTHLLSIPFTDGGKGEGLTPSAWTHLDFALIRIETECGLVGWGEAFSYFCADAVKHVVDRMIAPILIGMELSDPAEISLVLQRKLTLFGRYGITMFAISGVDIALWDLVSKAAGQSLAGYMGKRHRNSVDAYASLVRYGDAFVAADFTSKARDEGYASIKLHEIERAEIEACHRAASGLGLSVDVNCNWSSDKTRELLPFLRDIDCMWLEEPVFPPEDFEALANLRGNVPLAAGENLCTEYQFKVMLDANAVTFPQPSITKVGGVSEFAKIAKLAATKNLILMPHSPYFGPGYMATLQMCAAFDNVGLFEYLYIWPDATPGKELPMPINGNITIPDLPGVGFEPDEDVIARYSVS